MKYFVYPLFENCDLECGLEYNNTTLIESLYYLTEEYEVDDLTFELYKNKEYPFEFKATSEYSASTDPSPKVPDPPQPCGS